MEHTLYLTDIIEKTSIPRDELVAIRHSLNHANARLAWDSGFEYFEEYQRIQPKNYFKGKRFIFSFVNEPGTAARFLGVYEVERMYPVGEANPMENYPIPESYSGDDYYFELKKLDVLSDLCRRLVIDWGRGTNNIVHFNWEALSKKPILKIDDYNDDVFPGYSNVLWSYSKMARLVGDPIRYKDVYQALSSVNGVYLVVDPIDHKQYIGSASGAEGIYGRWKTYAETQGRGGVGTDEGNKRLVEHLKSNPGRYLKLQYSILDTLHRTGNELRDRKAALDLESSYKEKLDTRNLETGLNAN